MYGVYHQQNRKIVLTLEIQSEMEIEIIGNSSSKYPSKPKQIQQNKVNENGFTSSLTIYQTLPIIYVIIITIQTIIIIIFIQQIPLKIALSVLWALVLISTSILWAITTSIVPTDTIQLMHKTQIQKGNSFNMNEFPYYCSTCQTCVSNNAFHCKQCNRCVEVFDHHCRWLNNCIGAKNYFQFIGLISCSELLLILHISVNIAHLLSIKNGEQTQKLLTLFYFQIIFSIFDFIIFCFNTSLLGMHIYLIIQKKTTIELIKERRINKKIHPTTSKKTNMQNICQIDSEAENSDVDFSNSDKKNSINLNFRTIQAQKLTTDQLKQGRKSIKQSRKQNYKNTLKIHRKITLQPLK